MTEGAAQPSSAPDDTLRSTLIDALAEAGSRRTVRRGDLLCVQGDDSSEAYVVLSGRIDALVDGHDGPVTVARHEAGALVGEVSTLIGGHRTASLRVTDDGEVAAIDRETVREVFDRHPDAGDLALTTARERTDRSRVAALLSAELEAPDSDVVAAISHQVTLARLSAGDVLFRRGDPADAAYLVVTGRLGVTDLDRDPHDDVGASTPSGRSIEIGRGGIVGEFGLLDGRHRSATVTALRDTSLARLSARDFASLSQDHSGLAMGLVRRILQRSAGDVAPSGGARSVSLVCVAPIDDSAREHLVDVMIRALDECGPSIRLDAASVDRTLGRDGLAETAPGEFGEVRLTELLHQSEADADHVVLDAGSGRSHHNWVGRCVRQGDQLVVLCSPDPGPDEAAVVDAALATAPPDLPKWLAVLHPADCNRPSGGASLLEQFGVDEVHHLRTGSERDLGRVARLAAGRGVGLVLSGGGARGNAHIGVYRNLLELGVPVDRVIGSSMGSIVAGAIGQQLDPSTLLDDMRRGSAKLLDYTLPIVSAVRGKRIVGVLDGQFAGWDIEDLWVPFSCLSTNLTTAQPHLHRTGPVARAIRTSVAIPGVLPPVAHGTDLLADGGVLDNLPVGVFDDDPSIGVIIASDVAPPTGPSARADFGLSVSGWALLGERVIPAPVRRIASTITRPFRRGASSETAAPGVRASDHPSLSATLLRSLMIGSAHSRDAHLASGAIDLYLDLDVRGIGLLDFETVDAAAERGAEQSRNRIENWLDERGGSTWAGPRGDH